jgi:photosystem II stability/assembly factor-like uncharacterized protein
LDVWDNKLSASDISSKSEAEMIGFDFIDEKTGWVIIRSSESDVYFTSDGGMDWKQLSPQLK